MGFTYGNRPGARIPSMEQRHFWFIADTLKAERANALSIIPMTQANEDEIAARLAAVRNLAEAFAIGCAASNSKFSRSKFMAACGFEDVA